jgi:hypothetical protein
MMRQKSLNGLCLARASLRLKSPGERVCREIMPICRARLRATRNPQRAQGRQLFRQGLLVSVSIRNFDWAGIGHGDLGIFSLSAGISASKPRPSGPAQQPEIEGSMGIQNMNWGHIVRKTAVAIGMTFVVAVSVYLTLRLFSSLL